MSSPRSQRDAVVVGASFAGLACALSLARAGQRVTVLDRKTDAGARTHTTGILVREVQDQIPLMRVLPAGLTRRIDGVRLYAPNLASVDLTAPGCWFLATDTPGMMRWLAKQAADAGADCQWESVFHGAVRQDNGWQLPGSRLMARYLVGADGPRSTVARSLGLGLNRKFLAGVEHEYASAPIAAPDRLHCFIDRRIMPGYIGWMVQGVHLTQVGMARRADVDDGVHVKQAMQRFLDKIAPLENFRELRPVAVRAGLIPCGGVVRPVAAPRALLVGDAAGMVSPVTAGGIHTALHHGLAAGGQIAAFLDGAAPDPALSVEQTYPRFRVKRAVRFLFDHFQTDWVFNTLLATRPMRDAASLIYFHRRGVY